ncbi:MAG TPA: hypothetical protein VIJ07_09855 [Dermatophilaceae bacterium]
MSSSPYIQPLSTVPVVPPSTKSAAWRGIKSLLGRCGSTGTRIVEGLARAGTHVADAATAVGQHPIIVPVAQALKTALALARPSSQWCKPRKV